MKKGYFFAALIWFLFTILLICIGLFVHSPMYWVVILIITISGTVGFIIADKDDSKGYLEEDTLVMYWRYEATDVELYPSIELKDANVERFLKEGPISINIVWKKME